MIKKLNEDGGATLQVPRGEANVNETAVETALRLLTEAVGRLPALLQDGHNTIQELEPSGPYFNLDQSEAFYAYHLHGEDFETLCAQLVVNSMLEVGDVEAKPEYTWINIHAASPLDDEGEERASTTQSHPTNEWHNPLKIDPRYSTIGMMPFTARTPAATKLWAPALHTVLTALR